MKWKINLHELSSNCDIDSYFGEGDDLARVAESIFPTVLADLLAGARGLNRDIPDEEREMIYRRAAIEATKAAATFASMIGPVQRHFKREFDRVVNRLRESRKKDDAEDTPASVEG